MSRRAVAVVFVLVVFVAVPVVSARLNPVYESHALVSLGGVSASGANSLAHNLALARGRTVQLAVQARYRSAPRVQVAAVGDAALEFRARSRHPAEAAGMANAHAEAFVEARRQELRHEPSSPEARGARLDQNHARALVPSVLSPARPAGAPLAPWPSEAWAVAGMALIALALAVPGRHPPDQDP